MTATLYFGRVGDRIKVAREAPPADMHILAAIPTDGIRGERAARKYLGRWCTSAQGQWFRATPDCLRAIEELTAGGLEAYLREIQEARRSHDVDRSRKAAEASWAATTDRSARTAPARAARDQKFLDAAGGDPVAAAELRKDHFRRISEARWSKRQKGSAA